MHVEPAKQQAEFYLPVNTPAMVVIGFWRLCNELQARVAAEGVGVLRSQVLVHVGSAGQELDPAVAPMLRQVGWCVWGGGGCAVIDGMWMVG